jgi:hypothetical protein
LVDQSPFALPIWSDHCLLQLHHFIADGVWDATPLETELLNQADRLVGGRDAVLVIDDTFEEG